MERNFLLTTSIGHKQRAAIYAVLSGMIPASFIELYLGNLGVTVVTALLQEHGLKVRQAKTKTSEKDKYVGCLAISRYEDVAVCVKDGIERGDWRYVCEMMEFPTSFARGIHPFHEALPEDFYPLDMKDNALLRFPLTKDGYEEQAAFIRTLMEKMNADFSELYDELHLPALERV